jgi:peptidoglycan hydrolase-like protein with peptidoglycan-binding domain
MFQPLIRGSVSPLVKDLQDKLKQLGYEIEDPHGTYSATTEAAVAQFQTDSQIDSDGSYGPDTHKALEAALEAAEQPEPAADDTKTDDTTTDDTTTDDTEADDSK